MVTLILVQHQSCKQQLLRMLPCGEEDREEENEEENRREGRVEERKVSVTKENSEAENILD